MVSFVHILAVIHNSLFYSGNCIVNDVVYSFLASHDIDVKSSTWILIQDKSDQRMTAAPRMSPFSRVGLHSMQFSIAEPRDMEMAEFNLGLQFNSLFKTPICVYAACVYRMEMGKLQFDWNVDHWATSWLQVEDSTAPSAALEQEIC
ncbi:unnamed protein product [Calypogeia fissa]